MMSDRSTQNGSGEKIPLGRSIVIKLPVMVQTAKCTYREKRRWLTHDENMKKYNEDNVNYCIMSKLRQHFVKLGNYVMRLMSVALRETVRSV